MRKATGKVVSLVLALALVVTSFSSNFAFAATETGKATIDTGEIYLANTSDKESSDDVEDGQTWFNLTDWLDLNGGVTKIETYDHMTADDLEISQVTVSGDNIIKVTKISGSNSSYPGAGDGDYVVSVRSSSGKGTATLKILLKGTVERNDGDEVTVRGSDEIKVVLLDAETPILTSEIPENATVGEALDGLNNLQKNPDVKEYDPSDEEEDVTVASTATGYVALPRVSANSPFAKYVSANVVKKADSYSVLENDVENTYVVDATGSKSDLKVDEDANSFTYAVMDPSVGNSVRLTLYSMKWVKDDDKGDYATTNKTLSKETLKVENKLVGDFTKVELGDGDDAYVNGSNKSSTLSKSKTYAFSETDGVWEATNAEINTNGDNIEINSGKVGNVTASKVVVNDGTVGAIDAAGDVEISGGTVESIDGNAHDVLISGGTVGSISDGGAVRVTSGKVTGAVSATSVYLEPISDEDPVSVGAVEAQILTIDGTDATASAASFFADSDDSSVTLIGSNAVLGGIDADYRRSILKFDGFVGTIPAPSNAYETNADTVETGMIISSEDSDEDEETNATITGNLSIYEIALETGTVTFTGNVKATNIGGGEATMVINAGALNITESVSTSNTLAIANPADVAPGTVVYTAASEIADEDSFIGKGYTVRVVSGTSTDALVIDGISFAGLSMNKTSAEIVVGSSETFTASAYPAGTQLPEGAYIKFFIDGDENYISGVDNQNGTATLTAKKYDSNFSVLNKATLTAYVYDEYDIELEEYGKATCIVNVIETPKVSYTSDTTGNVNVVAGNTYQFKITSVDGTVPQFAIAGDNAIFKLVAQSQEGNDYFFKVQAVGTVGQVCGVYVNKEATPVATLTVSADYTCDTTTVNVPVGGTYQVKITANSMPTLAAGNSIYTVAFASQSGNDYFFKITATENAKAGDVVGFYINGGARAFVATTI